MPRTDKLYLIEQLLDGIDRTDGDNGGWWETSKGEEMGAEILVKIRALFPLRNFVVEFTNNSGEKQNNILTARELVKIDDQHIEKDGVIFTLKDVCAVGLRFGEIRLSSRQPATLEQIFKDEFHA